MAENVQVVFDPEENEIFYGPVTTPERILMARFRTTDDLLTGPTAEIDEQKQTSSLKTKKKRKNTPKGQNITEILKDHQINWDLDATREEITMEKDAEVSENDFTPMNKWSPFYNLRSTRGRVAKELFRNERKGKASPRGKINKSINSFPSESLTHNPEQDLDASFELINIKDDSDDSSSSSCNLFPKKGKKIETGILLNDNKNYGNPARGVKRFVENFETLGKAECQPTRRIASFWSPNGDSRRCQTAKKLPFLKKNPAKYQRSVNRMLRSLDNEDMKRSGSPRNVFASRIPTLSSRKNALRNNTFPSLIKRKLGTEVRKRNEENKDPKLRKDTPSVPCKVGFVKKEIRRLNARNSLASNFSSATTVNFEKAPKWKT